MRSVWLVIPPPTRGRWWAGVGEVDWVGCQSCLHQHGVGGGLACVRLIGLVVSHASTDAGSVARCEGAVAFDSPPTLRRWFRDWKPDLIPPHTLIPTDPVSVVSGLETRPDSPTPLPIS